MQIVLLVTVTKVETQATLDAFGAVSPKPRHLDGRVYFDLGPVGGSQVFLTRCEMGTGGLGASQQAVQQAIASLRPVAAIMLGIAFGVDEEKQSAGDILVAERLCPYELQRVGTGDDGEPSLILRSDRPHASVLLLNLLRSAEVTWAGSDVRFGTVLSGEKLVDNLAFRSQLVSLQAEAIGGEMEGAGLYVSCHQQRVEWILVKAICDFADGNKAVGKSSRQAIAARNAASFVRHCLEFVEVDWGRTSTCDATRSGGGPESDEVSFAFMEGEEAVRCRQRIGSVMFDVVDVDAHTHELGIAAQYRWMERRYPGFQRVWQALKSVDGRAGELLWFDVHQIELADGRVKQVWFNISSFWSSGVSSTLNPGEHILGKIRKVYLG